MALSLPAIMKTTAARLSALYLLLFALCAVLLVFYMTSLSARMLTAQTQETINDEVLGLARAYQRGGLPVLVRVVENRSRQPGANLYLIADANGQILTGNVQSLEPGVIETEGWTTEPFSYQRFGEGELDRLRSGATDQPAPQAGDNSTPQSPGEKGHNAIALVLRLPNQMIMLVGRDLGEPERFRAVISRALTLALGMMGLGGLLIWFFVGRAALKRIDSVSDASRRIMGGDLSGRLPVTGAGDEFDRLSENLNAMLARIAMLNEGLKQVSDNIAHDLKTPLTRLRNRAEATLAGRHKTEDYRQALEGTIAESDQLIKTFNAILMISRLEAGYSSEQTGPVDLAATVSDVVELYEPVAEEAGVTLEATVPEAFTINGNRELIGQALSNIVDNAIKYSTDAAETPRVRVALERAGSEIKLTVTDNGHGIPDDADRARATERFVRLEKSRSQPGSGLGLSLAKAIMTFHNGRLDLLPANPGLSVVMSFPLRETH
ncbi:MULTISPECIES: HAMP domain-containing sensor histidine kinase [unclassified Mesorhizobium]|uniref:sensor histidine kinase n=1 Tax=unclassified Mesorhizobium TaxID=325217 RepID=UPI000F764926|nr:MULTISPECIES: HAMP domain-containing sensor histidine kinase [unclassified Mesorhizobium]AZO06105.1 HAMP domain-containing histidine kinase [Mesorhizobium sp. M2A.F.Ca.ET.043.02.1.1]RUW40825.1 HAMP domain-containing histidine kinase [Mesorhizobium sp. M2A.F.Ca.ET.015.02.1.1]RUW73131.1 HAMP domain-containing histidine kinase [Mesorhizobium sp. M2A.F.Ca.ET.067.02.1.1]RVC94482.1 HAMP domain-containing histidine kinase [Mesorhizobium sp. M2A.F.Ca.ET.017.03.2.1]RVD05143.1 HAMP domain-containing 